MPDGVKINLEKDLIVLLDKHRGDLSRDEFINRILDEHLKNEGRINFSKYETTDTDNDRDAFLTDFKDFADNIYNRLDKLEDILNSQALMQGAGGTEDYKPNSDNYPINEDTDKESITFEVDESDDDNFDLEDSPSEYISETPYPGDFEYGCPFCSATISKDAATCPNCGNNLDDIKDEEEYEAIIVDPLPEQYSDTRDYDPRPKYIKPQSPRERSPSWSEDTYTPSHLVPKSICDLCGGKMDYIEEYKRWYCYNCKKYAGSIISPSVSPSKPYEEPPYSSKAPPRVKEPRQGMPHKRPHPRKHKPLRDYPKYRS